MEYEPYKIAIPARWEFSGLVQGLSKQQIVALQSINIPGSVITVQYYNPVHVFFDQFRFKKYLKHDVSPTSSRRLSMVLVLLFFWLAFLITLLAAALAYYLSQPGWMVDSFCVAGVLLLSAAVGATFWDHLRKRKWSFGTTDPRPVVDGSIHGTEELTPKIIPDLSDGEGVVVILAIMIAILLAMFFFVFIWLPILYVILNLMTLGRIGDRYRTLRITVKNPQRNVLNWLATQILLSGGYLSSYWDPWIVDDRLRHIARITREEHGTFINSTIAFTIISFVFAFFLVAYRIFGQSYLILTALVFGVVALGFFVFLLYLVFKTRSVKKELFAQIQGH